MLSHISNRHLKGETHDETPGSDAGGELTELHKRVDAAPRASPANCGGILYALSERLGRALFSPCHEVDLLHLTPFYPKEGRHLNDLGAADEVLRVGAEPLQRRLELMATHRPGYLQAKPATSLLTILYTEITEFQCSLPCRNRRLSSQADSAAAHRHCPAEQATASVLRTPRAGAGWRRRRLRARSAFRPQCRG